MRKKIDDLAKLQVVRAEIMTPLRDAVRFVDCEKAQFRPLKRLAKAFRAETFRGDVQKFEASAVEFFHDGAPFVGGRRRVERRRADSVLLRRVDLVFHQREKGTHHNAHPVHKERRKLVAKRFAPAGGHDGENVATFKDRADDRFLMRTKTAITENVGERLIKRIGGFCRHSMCSFC